jgi:hypothetical protein
MKKMLVLGIVISAIILGFTACDGEVTKRGGTVLINNDTEYRTYFEIRFDDNYVRVNDGQTYIGPSQTIQAVSDTDTSFAVYLGSSSNSWNKAAKSGRLSGGETITVMVSECDITRRGGTVTIINDPEYRTYFEIRFDDEVVSVNEGATHIEPNQTVQAVSSSDTTYAVYIGSSSYWDAAKKSGDLSGGETISIKVSDYY